MLLLLSLLFGVTFAAKCPSGALMGPFNDVCYQFTPSPLDFMRAEEQCKSLGGHLASVDNGFTNAFLAENAKTIFGSSDVKFWLGGTDLITKNVWQWIDGAPFSYTNWGPGQPNAVSDNQCIIENAQNGQWENGNCFQVLNSICIVPMIEVSTCPPPPTCPTISCPTIPTVTVPKCPPRCPSEWTYFDVTGYCYRVFYNKQWSDAEAECVLEGSHLASIHSDVENVFVANIATTGMKVVTNHQCWIGLSDVSGKGDYKWTDGSALDYQKWASGQPSSVGKENCIQVFSDESEWPTERDWYEHWNDYNCDTVVRAFVCKKKAI